MQRLPPQSAYARFAGGSGPGQYRPLPRNQYGNPELLVTGESSVSGEQQAPTQRAPPTRPDQATDSSPAQQPFRLAARQDAGLFECQPVELAGILRRQPRQSRQSRKSRQSRYSWQPWSPQARRPRQAGPPRWLRRLLTRPLSAVDGDSRLTGSDRLTGRDRLTGSDRHPTKCADPPTHPQ
ncbi:hypothetical protein Pen02_07180 [Plantactinospora endophytica]|uniref:Uncharacterized protein n=1 Tax=Plantactinospora endophytica TaxID=673535 RepID=A0ABQ4DTL2_9ACTN|nr:hypothetical protein Pen02_07180 [Plantactinospora endophytica]